MYCKLIISYLLQLFRKIYISIETSIVIVVLFSHGSKQYKREVNKTLFEFPIISYHLNNNTSSVMYSSLTIRFEILITVLISSIFFYDAREYHHILFASRYTDKNIYLAGPNYAYNSYSLIKIKY